MACAGWCLRRRQKPPTGLLPDGCAGHDALPTSSSAYRLQSRHHRAHELFLSSSWVSVLYLHLPQGVAEAYLPETIPVLAQIPFSALLLQQVPASLVPAFLADLLLQVPAARSLPVVSTQPKCLAHRLSATAHVLAFLQQLQAGEPLLPVAFLPA